jgi:symplekin
LISISSKEEEMKDESDSNKSGKRRAGPLPPQKLKKIKMFDLSAVVKPMEGEEKERLSVEAFRRILTAGKVASHGINSSQVHSRLVIHLVTQYGGEFNRTLLQHILDDFKSHFELALMWLYAEYCIGEQLIVTPANTLRYDDCLISLMKGAKSKLEPRDRLFTRLMLECPLVTSNAIEIIRDYCKEEERVLVGVGTLKELIIKRSQGSGEFLESLLEMTMSELEQARLQSLHTIKRLYETKPNLSQRIEKFAVKTLQKLLSDHPSFYYDSDIEVASEWSEESVKMCVGLFLLLLPVNSQLVKELAIVYTNTLPAVKRIILKLLDQPVRSIGMGSPELLELVENCPTGAETLIMRILYILTEKAAPSAELVNRVRELYQRNSSDVRFLIPVLHGLQKSEVIAALPQFIRLSPNVVKGVFERLLMSYKGEGSITMSPVSPSELLIALHNIECRGDEPLIKAIIRATSLCFSEKSVYTQEVLAVVLQQLVEQTPIPILMMRTVLQSLAICPRLVNFVLTLLTKLISKQIWKQPKVWQGFIKCCEQLKPHSFQVLLQLPPHQLEAVLKVIITYIYNVHSFINKEQNYSKYSLL